MSVRATMILLAAMLAVPMGLSAQSKAQADPLFGTWKLNQAKSNFGGRPSPGELTRVYEPIPNGVRIVRELEGADGKPTRGGWDMPFDGKDHPVKGDHRLDTLALKRIDAHTVEAVAKQNGKLTNTMRWDISPDGKTLKWTSKRILPPEEAGTIVRIYDRQ